MEQNNSAKGGSPARGGHGASGGKKNRQLKGVITSDKMQKTVVVAVMRLKKHPKYKKYYKVTNKFKAHDEKGEYHTGDKVFIQETRPMSKDKRWVVVGKI